MKRTFVLFVIAAGCGSSTPPTPAAPPPSGEAHGDEHMDHMDLSPELAKFHDVLAPRWHAEPGAPRMKATCDAVPEFLADADAVAQSTPPAGADAGAWKSNAAELVAAVGAVKAVCGAGDAAAFEPAFARVHVGFHHMMEASGMHGMHAGHDGDMHGMHDGDMGGMDHHAM